MVVAIVYDTDNKGDQREVCRLRTVGGRIVPSNSHPSGMFVLNRYLIDRQGMVRTRDDGDEFLRLMPGAYGGSRLRVGLEVEGTKGDLPGHPFRGNQWSGGQGGDSGEEREGGWEAAEKVLQFHGTLEKNLQSILTDGIVPSADKRFAESSQGDRGSKVFSTGSLAVADWYGKTAALYAPEGSKYAVFEIEVPKNAMQLASRDMSSADSWMFDKIPPEWIKAVHVDGERRQLTKAVSKGVYVPLVFSSEKK